MPVRTTYRAPWQPPPFRPSTERRRWIPRGSGVEEGGNPGLIGTIKVFVRPAGQVTVGQQVTFTAVRTGGGAPLESYAWSGPSGPIPGATGPVYSFIATSPADSGTYTVTVTSAGASDSPQSAGAAIVIVPAPPTTSGLVTNTGAAIVTDTGARIVIAS